MLLRARCGPRGLHGLPANPGMIVPRRGVAEHAQDVSYDLQGSQVHASVKRLPADEPAAEGVARLIEVPRRTSARDDASLTERVATPLEVVSLVHMQLHGAFWSSPVHGRSLVATALV
jgi:hypothetical protein